MTDELKVDVEITTGKLKSSLDGIEKKSKVSGQNIGKSLEKSVLPGALKLVGAITAIGTGIVSALAGRASLRAAQVQEDSINRLNTSLRLAGTFSEDASQRFQNLASSLQGTSKFGDELILSQAALARNFTQTNEQAEQLIKAAVDLSAATGMTLDSAVRNLGKTYSGLAGELGESIPAMRELTSEQLKSGAAIDLITKRFGGAAAAELNTFSGISKSLANTIGDLSEEFGFFVTKSPEVTLILKNIKSFIQDAIVAVGNFRKSFSIINDVLIPLARIGDAIVNYVIPPLEMASNIGKVAFDLIVVSINDVIAAFASMGGFIGSAISKITGDNSLTNFLGDFAETSKQVADESQADFQRSLSGMFDFPLSDKLATKNEELRMGLENMRTTIAEQNALTGEELNQSTQQVTDNMSMQASSFMDFMTNVNISFQSTAEKLKQTAQQVSQVIQQNLVRGISGGIQNIVNSVAKGENAFANFGKFLLNTIGDMAIQLGQTLIGAGIGIESLKALGGTAAIAAGAGLVALGAVLKSFSGGSAGAQTSSSTSTGGNNFAPVEPAISTDPDTIERAKEKPSVNLTVQGNYFDSQDSRLEIVKMLGEAMDVDGAVIRNPRFA